MLSLEIKNENIKLHTATNYKQKFLLVASKRKYKLKRFLQKNRLINNSLIQLRLHKPYTFFFIYLVEPMISHKLYNEAA